MLFSSFQFLFYFLPVFLLLYASLRSTQLRNILILVGSLFFYAWGEASYVLVMIFSITLTWLFGILIDDAPNTRFRALALFVGVSGNLLLLAYFKYAAFFIGTLFDIGHSLDIVRQPLPAVAIHMPIGISFFTFQAISYLVDLYRNHIRCQRNILILGMYKSMFPQLIAGPIVRYAQIQDSVAVRPMRLADIIIGLHCFAIGLAQKTLLANPIGAVANQVFNASPGAVTATAAWIGAFAYAMQIFFDFSGYSNMAIGLGRVMGFRLPENFNFPYTANSISDFWRRWHMTLSAWFRDYVYIPMGGSRCSKARNFLNLLVVFLLCGLWHGADWNFVIWGAYHGLLICFEKAGLMKLLEKLPPLVRIIYTFIAVLFGWVLFRSESLGAAVNMMELMLGINKGPAGQDVIPVSLYDLLGYESMFFMTIAIFLSFNLGRFFPWGNKTGYPGASVVGTIVAIARGLFTCGIFFLALAYLAGNTFNPFIYFRF